MKNKIAAWIILALIAIVAAALLATTNEVTRDVIQEQNLAAMQEAWATLVPGAEFPEGADAAASEEGVPAEYVYAGLQDGQTVGYVAQVVAQGYGGDMDVIVGTDTEGTIKGIQVGGANFKETAGLGAKAKDAAFTDQFMDLTAPVTLGENVDAITAATITSSAVVRAVNTAVENIAEVAGFTIEKPAAEAGSLGDGRFTATMQGFAGPVYVEIQLDDANVIQSIIIGDDQFAETSGYGAKAQEPAFYEQFIGKTGQLTLGEDIDAISGATITSNAVIDAVNLAMLYATDPEAAAAQGQTEEFVLPDVPEDALTASASEKGFEGPVAAEITIDPQTREILRVTFGDDDFQETPGFGAKALEPAFWQPFIGKTLPVAEDDVDMITGATITSKAAIAAVNEAYYTLFPDEKPEEAAFELPEVPADALTSSASRMGYAGPVAVEITFDKDSHELLRITIGDDQWAETDGIGSRVKEDAYWQQYIGKTLPVAEDAVDAVSGATVTSTAVFEAVNKAYAKLFPEEESAPAEETAAPQDTGAAEASSKGYGGPVQVKVEVDDDGKLTAIEIGGDLWAETDGLGSKIKEAAFTDQFIGKTLPLADGDIDAVSGATVSSDAAVAAVNKAYAKIEEARAAQVDAPDAGAADGAARTAEASSKGYGGPVQVTIEVNADNMLASIEIGGDLWAETDGLGSKIKEAAFTDQFVGKALPLADGDIDAVSGATVSSDAAVAAVNKAFDKLAADTTEPQATDAPAQEPAVDGEPRTAEASSKGYGGPVQVTIEVNADNTLASIEIGGDLWAETDGLGSKIKEAAFTDQFIGKALPLADGDIDAVSGATVSSEAAFAAVNKAFDKLGAAEEAAPEATEAPADEPVDPNTAEASSKGYVGPVQVKITVDEDNVLTAVEIGGDLWAETDGLGSKVQEPAFIDLLLGKTLPLGEGDVDAITGATLTSEAAVAAINKAFEKVLDARCQLEGDRTAEASSKGYGGPVQVTITVDAEGVLTSLEIGGDLWAETDGLGSKIKEPAFTDQFIGKTLPLAEGDIDAVTGATVSSEAAVSAVNKAFDKLQAQ